MRYSRLLSLVALVSMSAVAFGQAPAPKGEKGGSDAKVKEQKPKKDKSQPLTAEEIETVRGWLGGKAMSIYGGSFEIQNNIISKRILGLPDTTQST